MVTRVDATAPAPVLRAVLGASATLIELGAGHPIFQVPHARQPDAGHQVYLYDQIAGAYLTSEQPANATAKIPVRPGGADGL